MMADGSYALSNMVRIIPLMLAASGAICKRSHSRCDIGFQNNTTILNSRMPTNAEVLGNARATSRA